MSKEKFLESLRKKLSILEESEIEDIISEYEGYIEEKIAQGSSEEEAVKSMGNVNELARDLLSAYKIKSNDTKDSLNNVVDSIIGIFNEIVAVFSNKSLNEILRFILEIVCIFIVIFICKIPFEIIESMGRGIFSSFGNIHVFGVIWSFILEVAYAIFAILLFIKIFESRYLNNSTNSHSQRENKSVKKKNVQEIKQENKSKTNTGVVDSLVNVCIWFFKFMLLFLLFGIGCYIVGLSIVLGVCVYMLIRGVFYFGVYLILFSLFIIGVLAFLFLFNFIFDRKNRGGLLLISFLVSFILLGIGTGVCTLEFANTTIVYSEENKHTVSEEYTFPISSNLILNHHFSNEDIIVDDSLKNEVKVVYSYDDTYMKIKANPYVESRGSDSILYTGYQHLEFKYSKELFEELINDLRSKTFVANRYNGVAIKLYVNSEMKEKLINNRTYSHDNDLTREDVCEYYYEHGHDMPEHCREYEHHLRNIKND